MMKKLLSLAAGLAVLAVAGAATAQTLAGERHLIANEAAARVRDAQHRDQISVTIWYPAAHGTEQKLDIGPPGRPLFTPGAAAPDADFADDQLHPVILLSHGYGGSARIMAWFGTALARAGYIVIAPDHPGNNAVDQKTIAGSTLFWERPGDLAAALGAAGVDPAIGPHIDIHRLGVAGFSAGGFTSLAAVGARVDLPRFRAFCENHPADGVCAPQKEFPLDIATIEAFWDQPQMAKEIAKARGDLSIRFVRAAFVMAPALVQSLDPLSLAKITVPVSIVAGDADVIAAPISNAGAAARLIPGAEYKILPGAGHYDFLATCGPDGVKFLPFCRSAISRADMHAAVLARAIGFFAAALSSPAPAH